MNLSIGTPLLKAHFDNHLNLKNNLLSLIDQSKTKVEIILSSNKKDIEILIGKT